jgi:Lanthionine synthetase C-like protein
MGLKDKRIIDTAIAVIQMIIKDGRHWSRHHSRILIKWPRDRKEDKYYLGGAHGLIGTLHMLLSSLVLIPDLQEDKDLVTTIKNSCDFMLAQ